MRTMRFSRHRTLRAWLPLLLIGLYIPVVPAIPVQAATRCVNPGGTGGCFASLQAAVNAAAPGDAVTVAAGTYIQHVVIPASLALIGADPATTIIDGQNDPNDVHPLVDITGGIVTVSGFTFRNAFHGGLYNTGQATVANCVFTDSAAGLGNMTGSNMTVTNSVFRDNIGGIGNDGEMIVTASTISHNSSIGIANNSAATTLAITDSTISGNGYGITSMQSGGGGILNYGTLSVAGSTISGNNGTAGAGIAAYGPTTVINSTITGNHAPPGPAFGYNPIGAGIAAYTTVALRQVTMSGNGGNPGRSPEGLYVNGPSQATLTASAIADSCGATLRAASGGYNVTALACFAAPQPSDRVAEPLLGPLANNGGPTQTQAIGASSPAFETIPRGDPACAATDQRGVARPQGAACDSGAYEYVPPPPPPVPAPRPGSPTSGSPAPAPPVRSALPPTPNPLPPHR